MADHFASRQLLHDKRPMKAREAAYRALVHYAHNQMPVGESLERWRVKDRPPSHELSLGQEIAYGTVRMQRALDALLVDLSGREKIKATHKERALLRMALYQRHFMDRIPLYAIAQESVNLAKKEGHQGFVGFLNALLRKTESKTLSLPGGDDLLSLAIRYSYPDYYIERLLSTYPLSKVKEILSCGNASPTLFLRLRTERVPEGVSPIEGLPLRMGKAIDRTYLAEWTASPDLYIQNITPARLVYQMSAYTSLPDTILDLCASPGGKLIALHDLFPEAKLYANDRVEKKVEILEENLKKYGIHAEIHVGRGEEYPLERKFSLILLDVPCSNTGVLNKRPEARWRLGEKQKQQLREVHRKLLDRAIQLLAPKGQIWWMTCSILPEENEEIVTIAQQEYGMGCLFSETVLPDAFGHDGGFGAILNKGDR